MLLTDIDQEQLKNNPGDFIKKAIRDYSAVSPWNRFTPFPDEPIWDEPLIGFASGDDPLFQQYKTIIGDFHPTPRETLERYCESAGIGKKDLSSISVISFIFPATTKTRLEMRKETAVCTLRWNHARYEGQEFIFRLSRYLVALLESHGYIAVAPELSKWWETVKLPDGPASTWSQRHIAYAAGLGTFSLSDGFITPRGIAMRAGSVVCNLALPPSPRPYPHHKANCLAFSGGKCRSCIQRCPAQAISEKGHDKIKCQAYLMNGMMEVFKKSGLESAGYQGKSYIGCGLCQTGVPCEDKIPVKA